jgi:hypothetical protein
MRWGLLARKVRHVGRSNCTADDSDKEIRNSAGCAQAYWPTELHTAQQSDLDRSYVKCSIRREVKLYSTTYTEHPNCYWTRALVAAAAAAVIEVVVVVVVVVAVTITIITKLAAACNRNEQLQGAKRNAELIIDQMDEDYLEDL